MGETGYLDDCCFYARFGSLIFFSGSDPVFFGIGFSRQVVC